LRQAYATGRINQVAISIGCVRHKTFGASNIPGDILDKELNSRGYITYRYTQY